MVLRSMDTKEWVPITFITSHFTLSQSHKRLQNKMEHNTRCHVSGLDPKLIENQETMWYTGSIFMPSLVVWFILFGLLDPKTTFWMVKIIPTAKLKALMSRILTLTVGTKQTILRKRAQKWGIKWLSYFPFSLRSLGGLERSAVQNDKHQQSTQLSKINLSWHLTSWK